MIIFLIVVLLIFFIYIITFQYNIYLPMFMAIEPIRQPKIADDVELYILNSKIKLELENELNTINNLNNDLNNNLNKLNNILNSNYNTILELNNELYQLKQLINDGGGGNTVSKFFLTSSLKPLLILYIVHKNIQIMLSDAVKFELLTILLYNKLLNKIK